MQRPEGPETLRRGSCHLLRRKGFTGRTRCSRNVTQTCKDLEQKSGWEETLMEAPEQKKAVLNKYCSLSLARAWAPE